MHSQSKHKQNSATFSPARLVRLAKKYDRAARNWQKSLVRNGYLSAYQTLIAHAVQTNLLPTKINNMRVLDAGAGTGGFSLALIHQLGGAFKLDLLDISRQMLSTAARNLEGARLTPRTICTSIDQLDQPDRAYDLILCAHTIEHCPDPVATLKNLRRHLKPDGVLLLVVSKPHWCTSLIRLLWRYKAYDAAQMLTLMTAADLHPSRSLSFASGPPKYTSTGYITTKTIPQHQEPCHDGHR